MTLLDHSRPWWLGVADVKEKFGIEVDIDALRELPIHLVVGSVDIDPGTNERSMAWMPGGQDAGKTPLERLRSLEASLKTHDIVPEFELVHGKAHTLTDMVPAAKAFFARQLNSAGTVTATSEVRNLRITISSGGCVRPSGPNLFHETIRFWWNRFGPMFASEIRMSFSSGHRSGKSATRPSGYGYR